MSWKWYWSLTSPLILINPFSYSADLFGFSPKASVCKSVKCELVIVFMSFFLATFVQKWGKKTLKIRATFAQLFFFFCAAFCAVFNAPAKIMHLCSSYKACLHASPQQRKVKSSVIVCVSFTHTRRPVNLFLLTKHRYEGWAMPGSSGRHRLRCMTKNRNCDSLVGERKHSRRSPHQFPLLRRALLRIVVVAGVWIQLQDN